MRFDTGLLFVPQTTPQQEKQNKKKTQYIRFLTGRLRTWYDCNCVEKRSLKRDRVGQCFYVDHRNYLLSKLFTSFLFSNFFFIRLVFKRFVAHIHVIENSYVAIVPQRNHMINQSFEGNIVLGS